MRRALTLALVLGACGLARLEAGGWAVVTLKDAPIYAVAGRPLTITYVVRQHGRTLLDRLTGHLQAQCGGRTVREPATPTGETGHYRATVTLPDPGRCTLVAASGFLESILPPGAVTSGPAASNRAGTAHAAGSSSAPVTILVLRPGEPPPQLTETAMGRHLFAAKGCVTCHAHPDVAADSLETGPGFATKAIPLARVAKMLAPDRDRTNSDMPDLGLSSHEVAALTAFLAGGSGSEEARLRR
jgi:hypothetical protein